MSDWLMSPWEASLIGIPLWTWGRSLLIAGVAWPIVRTLHRMLVSLPPALQVWGWVGLWLPFFTPALLVGYTYGRGVLALREWQGWNEACYLFLSLARWVPVGLLIAWTAPSSDFSESAWHCWKIKGRRNRSFWIQMKENLIWRCRGEEKKYFFASGIIFLTTFHEFELAALMGVTSWSVWLFDAQSGGLILSESLYRLSVPLILQCITLGPLLWLAGGGWVLATDSPPKTSVRATSCWPAWCWLVVAGFFGSVVPWISVIHEGRNGWGKIWSQSQQWRGLFQESLTGLLIGGCASLLVVSLSVWLLEGLSDIRRFPVRVRWISLVPGLFGPLTVAFVCLWLSQNRWTIPLLHTGVSWLVALVLWLMPVGLLLQIAMLKQVSNDSVYLAEMLSGSRSRHQKQCGRKIWWQMRGDGWMWMIATLCYWSYFDLTISSILAPAGSVSAPVRLFNQMHYGQSTMLAALTAGGVLIPILFFGFFLILRRFLWLRGNV